MQRCRSEEGEEEKEEGGGGGRRKEGYDDECREQEIDRC